MKKTNLIRIGIIVLMLGCMVTSVHAADKKTSPEDWLNDEEVAYVTAIRSADASARSAIASATGMLWNAKVLDKKWASEYDASLKQLYGIFGSMCISAPKEFEAIGEEYCAFSQRYSVQIQGAPADQPKNSELSNSEKLELFGDLGGMLGIAQVLAGNEQMLDSCEADLDKLAGKMNAKIADIAKRREKAAELFGDLFLNCLNK